MRAQTKTLWLCVLLGMGFQARPTAPVSGNLDSLCDLQRSAKQGERRFVRVSGTYSSGFEMGVLTNPECPSQHTWIELDLKSDTNKGVLRSVLAAYGRAEVIFEGEFYGSATADPKLPESIRKSYHPGWGHLGAFRTKLVVHAIKRVNSGMPKQPGGHGSLLPSAATAERRPGTAKGGLRRDYLQLGKPGRYTGDMERDWLEFARKLAEGARAQLAEDSVFLETKQTQKPPRQPPSKRPASAR